MRPVTGDIESRDDDASERTAAERETADGLADLSRTEDVPSEVEASTEFAAEAVIFDDNRWLEFVCRTQDWLRLPDPVASEGAVAERALALFAGLGMTPAFDGFVLEGGLCRPSAAGLDRLRDRVVRAVDLRDAFLESFETTGSIEAATEVWIAGWDDVVEEVSSEPVVAKALTWSINEFSTRAIKGKLDLAPSYQRADVWPTKDAQLLIESILRGIPLPSVIILKPSAKDAPFEVVDGKQRLTSILRFMGSHPEALRRVKEADEAHPGEGLARLFHEDYPGFRTKWKNVVGDLSGTQERGYHFPFKLSTASDELVGVLSRLRGKYYCQIKSESVSVGGDDTEIGDLFEQTVEYKLPVIMYTSATPRQIHEVFNLYNRQGKHLNAEEIRNAVFHHLDLMLALSVASGDNEDLEGSTPFLVPIKKAIERTARALDDYKFGDMRYRRTKVLSWLFSMLFVDSAPGGVVRKLSTAAQTDSLLKRIDGDPSDAFRSRSVILEAFTLVDHAIQGHQAANGAWATKFRNQKGTRWQELQLIASLLGVALATAVVGGGISDLLLEHQAALNKLSFPAWKRPDKTQTGKQWEYIATVALGIVEELGVDKAEVSKALLGRFKVTCVPGLEAAASSKT